MIEFTHTIPKEKEGTYYTVPFAVPDNVSKITVSYDYPRSTKGLLGDLHPSNTVDIGLMDEKGRFLGWSGSAHNSIFVGEYGSSSGYLSQPINAGQWKIIVGAYHVVDAGVDVKYTIEFEENKLSLLFGDLHVHSDASDGRFDTYTLGKMAKENGLDFIGIANHNNYAENFNLPKIEDLTFIKAVEWTHYKGHMNFFGAAAPFENSFIANNENDMKKIIADARTLGAVISVNHPKCHFCPYLWEDDESFEMIEIWNGPMHKTNIDAIEWWTKLLQKGRRISIVGGSDYHRPHSPVRLAHPVTAVFSPSRSEADILNSIKNGYSFVTAKVDGIKLDMSYNDAHLGQIAEFSDTQYLRITAENLNGAKLVLVTQSGEQIIKTDGRKTFTSQINIKKTNFVYLKAVKGKGKLYRICAITNPIYFN